jgi:hypothetical protein
MPNPIITILSSGVALGVYVPPLIIHNQLRSKGVDSDFVVLESIYQGEMQSKILNSKFAFHRNFKLAQLGHRMAKTTTSNHDEVKVDALFRQWSVEGRTRFLIFSGFWIPILEEYIQRFRLHHPMDIEVCHIDTSFSPSFKSCNCDLSWLRHTWLMSHVDRKINFKIEVSQEPPIPYHLRDDRCVIHGGGWGMGNYKEVIQELEDAHINLDIIAYEDSDIAYKKYPNRYYMIDPDWRSWEKGEEGCHVFPPFFDISGDSKIRQVNNIFHGSYTLVANEKAVISKPGGGTILDSLSSGTPVIFLEPLAEHERHNQLLWSSLGFGITYNEWKSSGFSYDILALLSSNIIKANENSQNYMEQFYAA